MTETEAREILNEHKTERPSFVRRRIGGGFWLYQVQRDGRTIDIYRMPASKRRSMFERTTTVDDYSIPADIRKRLA